jgi:hypothetical protein
MPGASFVGDPEFRAKAAEYGRKGARRRWGAEPRVVRLDSLTADQRRLIVALIGHMGGGPKAGDQNAG